MAIRKHEAALYALTQNNLQDILSEKHRIQNPVYSMPAFVYIFIFLLFAEATPGGIADT